MQFAVFMIGILLLIVISSIYESNKRRCKLRIRLKEQSERIAYNEKFIYEQMFQDLKSKVTNFKKISRIISMMKSRKDTSL